MRGKNNEEIFILSFNNEYLKRNFYVIIRDKFGGGRKNKSLHFGDFFNEDFKKRKENPITTHKNLSSNNFLISWNYDVDEGFLILFVADSGGQAPNR